MASKLIEIFVMEGIALLMFLFAYLIGARGKLELIAGYNERTASRVKDKDGLKRLITRLCVLLGIAAALMPVLTHFAASYPHGLEHVTGGFGGFILGVIGMVMLQARDYTT
jgi:hypothetical protein